MKKEILIISCFIITLFCNCSKDKNIINDDNNGENIDITTNLPPTNFNISVEQVKYNSVLLKWDESTDPENTTIKYSIYLENNLIQGNISKLELKLENLTEVTTYNGYIIAEDEYEKTTRINFTFSTIKYYLTFIKEYEYINAANGGLFSPRLHEVLITNDGNYLFSGTINLTPSGGGAFFTAKIDQEGNEVWFKKYDIDTGHGFPEIKETSDGGFIILGWYNFLKLDSLGNLEWSKTFPCGAQINCELFSASETNDGNYLVGGHLSNDWNTTLSTGVATKAYLILIDNNGNILWKKSFGSTWSQSIRDIIHNGDNTFTVFGDIEASGYTYDPNQSNIDNNFWVIKIDIDGNIIWEKSYGDGKMDFPKKIIKTSGNNFVFIGNSWGAYDISESVIYKINNNGNVIWNTPFQYSNSDSVYSVIENLTGEIMILNQTEVQYNQFSMVLNKYSRQGTLINNKFYTNYGGFDLKPTSDGGYILATSYGNNGSYYARILKTDPEGNFEE
ncbi:hypothetical protein PG911_07955 [Tenacibaculum ovolyticum]|uniref:fibronectin type III domain-containing protein n=1 Tax=Tenacibaculum ovolyticum TaxID=104270 RepID=UPI0007EDBB92|nr:hypothetical protein [Tenacibaculum ovolyticum]WBX78175.1 hypothetical protein PG911_07955 [Tenacibaculum ovolyticum]